MANIFVEAWRGIKAWADMVTGRRTVTEIKKDLSEGASKIAHDIGYFEEDEEFVDDAVFDYMKFGHSIDNLEVLNGYSLSDYADDFEKVYVGVATYGIGSALVDNEVVDEVVDGLSEGLPGSDEIEENSEPGEASSFGFLNPYLLLSALVVGFIIG